MYLAGTYRGRDRPRKQSILKQSGGEQLGGEQSGIEQSGGEQKEPETDRPRQSIVAALFNPYRSSSRPAVTGRPTHSGASRLATGRPKHLPYRYPNHFSNDEMIEFSINQALPSTEKTVSSSESLSEVSSGSTQLPLLKYAPPPASSTSTAEPMADLRHRRALGARPSSVHEREHLLLNEPSSATAAPTSTGPAGGFTDESKTSSPPYYSAEIPNQRRLGSPIASESEPPPPVSATSGAGTVAVVAAAPTPSTYGGGGGDLLDSGGGSNVRLRQVKAIEEYVKIRVAERKFCLSRRNVKKYPETTLATALEVHKGSSRELFFDRSAEIFVFVANFYRTGRLHVPQHVCTDFVREELQFWGIEPEKYVADCCKANLFVSTESQIQDNEMEAKFAWSMDLDFTEGINEGPRCCTVIFKTLDDASYSIISSVYGFLYLACVFVSFVTFISRTIDEAQVSVFSSNSTNWSLPESVLVNPKAQRVVSKQLHPVLMQLDFICSVVFISDLVLRVLFCPKRLKFLLTGPTIIDVLATCATVSRMVIKTKYMNVIKADFYRLMAFEWLDVLKLLRAVRILKFTSKYSGLRVLIIALRDSITELALLINFMIIGMILFSVLMYYCEFNDKDSVFDSVPKGFWWAVVTMTTVGYGDLYPTTLPGYVAGACCAVTGLIFVALPIPVVSNNFTYLYEYANKQRLRLSAEKNVKILSIVELGAEKMMDGLLRKSRKLKSDLGQQKNDPGCVVNEDGQQPNNKTQDATVQKRRSMPQGDSFYRETDIL